MHLVGPRPSDMHPRARTDSLRTRRDRRLNSVHRIEIRVHAQNDSTRDYESDGIEENRVFIIGFTATCS